MCGSWPLKKTGDVVGRREDSVSPCWIRDIESPLLPVNRQCTEHMNQRFRTQCLADFSRITNVPHFPFHSCLRRAHSFETLLKTNLTQFYAQQDPHCAIKTQTNKVFFEQATGKTHHPHLHNLTVSLCLLSQTNPRQPRPD